jgi:hypothetical protein
MHRVARLSVGKLEIQYFLGDDAIAGSGQGYSGWREIAKAGTRSR